MPGSQRNSNQSSKSLQRYFVLWLVGVCLISSRTLLTADEPIDFETQIRPLLTDKCFLCHGPDSTQRQSGLRLDVRREAVDYGAIVPHKPDESLLVQRIFETDQTMRMPPVESHKSLTEEEKGTLRRWIAEGAPYQVHWAYRPPASSETPVVHDAKWPLNWIDNYLLCDMEQAGVSPAPPADRRTLLRRVYFDLIGLPPTPEELHAFLADSSPGAYEKVVDRLLASEHFGERLAIYWLDLVRYADTVGYHGDQDHNISPYRDWVIDALNDNMRFDQFTRAQLAGDLLPDPSVDQIIATGYNRLLQTSHEGGVQPGEYRAIYAADRVRNLSGVWMAATIGCAQCHDHKYDPYTTEDFYSLSAFFADIDDETHLHKGQDTIPTSRPPEIKVHTRRERERIAELKRQIADLEAGQNSDETSANSPAPEIAKLTEELTNLESSQRMTMITKALDEPRVTRVLPRGNWMDESGAVVQPRVPKFLPAITDCDRRKTRLDLANWLMDTDHGIGLLTARVFANRFWYLYFGEGLAKDLGDFGGQGYPPRHPQLLDRLAIELASSGWNVKQLIREVVTSRAYQMASVPSRQQQEQDPENALFCRQNRFRLVAELIRDNALAVSGLLVDEIGGPSAKPYQPKGYYRHLNFPPRQYHADSDSQQWRRGVYVHWQRQYLQPMLKAFDAPTREECTAQRPRNNTPLGALALLNDPSMVEAARMLAAHILDWDASSTDARIDFGFELCTSRLPNDSERMLLKSLLSEQADYYGRHPDLASESLKVGIAKSAVHEPEELAAWMSVSRVLLNLNETIYRN